MEKILKNERKKETLKLRKLISKFPKITKQVQNILKENGYQYWELGTGNSSISYSGDIGTWDVRKNKFFPQGLFFGVGICNKGYGKGCIYRAFVKEIIE